MIKEKKGIDYKIVTLVLVVFLTLSLIFSTIPNQQQTKYDKFCKAQGLDYANVNMVFAEFECCRLYEVSDWENNQTLHSEGCLAPLDFEVVK